MRLPEYLRQLKVVEGTKHILLLNELDNSLWLLKILKFYDIRVFEYLKNHTCPNIPTVHYYTESNDTLFVVEEYIDGVTLDQYLGANPNLTIKEKIKIINDICNGLKLMHSATPTPIVHRDIKPSNIMIDKNGVAYVIDYDAAKIYKSGADRDTRLIGTDGSAAPEQYGFAQSDPRTDVFAMGKLLEILFKDDIKSQSWIVPIIKKATSMDPKDRYQSIDKFAEALKYKSATPHKLLPPPGFRTMKIPKIVIAILGYIGFTGFMILWYAKVFQLPNTLALNLGYAIMITIYLFLNFDLFTEWTVIFSKLPFQKSDKYLKRLPVKLVVALGLFGIERLMAVLLRLWLN
ncbi:MAG: serine/threonine protein kinase [Clostridia bacterium]|nr:serine/threonine protein kinase [Clostridia bacterium]